MNPEQQKEAWRHSSHNRYELLKSDQCGCFCCCRLFVPQDIQDEDWIDDGQTALCPYCGVDSIIGSASGYKLDETFLTEMKNRWF